MREAWISHTGTTLKSIIVNQRREPKLFVERHDATVDGFEIMGGFVTCGDTFGLFTLRETDYEPANLASECWE